MPLNYVNDIINNISFFYIIMIIPNENLLNIMDLINVYLLLFWRNSIFQFLILIISIYLNFHFIFFLIFINILILFSLIIIILFIIFNLNHNFHY